MIRYLFTYKRFISMENFVLYFKNILTKYISDVMSYLHF